MKIQIIKIIPCLLAGFILSACVGAVNIPSSVAEKKTESDPVIKKTAVVIIDDKEPAHPCIANPFRDTCDSADFNNARKAVCVGSNSERCAPIIKRECESDSLDALCDGLEKYFTAQYRACESDNMNPRCNSTTARICKVDSLDAICNGLETYFTMQYEACKAYNYDHRCNSTTARVCGADSLDIICNGLTAYFPAQKIACETVPNSERCAPTRARICHETPFSALCQSNNLTGYDLRLMSGLLDGIGGIFDSYNEPPTAYCSYTRSRRGEVYNQYVCIIEIPELIDIQPLNDTNTGTATYAGSVWFQYAFNPALIDIGHRSDNPLNTISDNNPAITKNINIIANFDDKTLTYSGNLGSGDNPFNINGSFTDRGILTGTVDFKSIESPLIGLIGQDEAIGIFRVHALIGNKSFAGGFTATRE